MYPWCSRSVGANLLARRRLRCFRYAASRTSSLLQRFRVFAGSRLNANPLERGLPAKLTARSVRRIREAASRASLAPTKADSLSTCQCDASPDEPMYPWCSRSVGANLLARDGCSGSAETLRKEVRAYRIMPSRAMVTLAGSSRGSCINHASSVWPMWVSTACRGCNASMICSARLRSL